MVLNRNPENYFAEAEQAAFCPVSIIPGIELSADKLLQGRAFAYADTQRHRLGPNFLQLPINRPRVSANNNQRDGAMQYAPYGGATANYEPNTLAGGMPHKAPAYPTSHYHLEGDQVHLVDNIVDSLGKADKPIPLAEPNLGGRRLPASAGEAKNIGVEEEYEF